MEWVETINLKQEEQDIALWGWVSQDTVLYSAIGEHVGS